MEYINAFILGGCICALFQGASMFARIKVPNMLIIGLFLGGLATVLGLADDLVSWGGAGFSILAIGAAQAFYVSLLSLFTGSSERFILLFAALALLIVLGFVAGTIRLRINRRKQMGREFRIQCQ